MATFIPPSSIDDINLVIRERQQEVQSSTKKISAERTPLYRKLGTATKKFISRGFRTNSVRAELKTTAKPEGFDHLKLNVSGEQHTPARTPQVGSGNLITTTSTTNQLVPRPDLNLAIESEFKRSNNGFKIKGRADTTGLLAGRLRLKNVLRTPEWSLIAQILKANAGVQTEIELTKATRNYNFSLSALESNGNQQFTFSSVFYPRFLDSLRTKTHLGLQANIKLQSPYYSDLVLATHHTNPNFDLTLKVSPNLTSLDTVDKLISDSRYSAQILHRYNPNTTLAADVSFSNPVNLLGGRTNDFSAELAVEHKLNTNSTIKAKVNTATEKGSVTLKYKASDKVSYEFGVERSSFYPTSRADLNYGFNFTFQP